MTLLSEKIIKLHKEGKSYRQIQEILTCSKGTIAYHLGTGQKEKTAERRKIQLTKIRQYLQEHKQSKPCADCGENYPYWIMDFDHLHNKSFNISHHRKFTNDLNLIKLEVQLCLSTLIRFRRFHVKHWGYHPKELKHPKEYMKVMGPEESLVHDIPPFWRHHLTLPTY